MKLDDVGWCERCLRPFDRPKPRKGVGNTGWRVCDECTSHKTRSRPRGNRKKVKARAH